MEHFSLDDDADDEAAESGEQQLSEEARQQQIADQLLQLLGQPTYQPVKPKVLAKKLGLEPHERKLLRRALKQLARQGLLHWGAQHVVRPVRSGGVPLPAGPTTTGADVSPPAGTAPATDDFLDLFGERPSAAEAKRIAEEARRRARQESNLIVGTFRRAASGYGFVRPETGDDEPLADRQIDIFIPQKYTLDAVTGDLVLVRLSRRRGRGARRYGEILEVVQRQEYQFVGTYQEVDGQPVVEVDGRVFSQPIPVADPTAKGVRPGDQVVIEIARFPRHYDPGSAVVVELLGPRGAPGVDTLAIIREYDLPEEFPEAVLREAREQADQFEESVGPDRQDFTNEVTITIDPEDARDFDDAVSLHRQSDGNWLLGVHIADVAHFVPRDSALDLEARRRGTSVYLPDRVIPMLPELISNHLASLQPNRLRYTRSVLLELTAEGIAVHAEIVRSAIRSKRRFTYDEVDDFFAHPRKWKKRLEPSVAELLLNMRQLAMTLRQRRLRSGALELTLPEVKILLDEQGRVTGARVIPRTVSHQIIEEFMLAANRAVAETLVQRHVPFLRRIHEPPTPIKLRALTEFVRLLGIRCHSLESRFEIQRVLEEVAGQPTEQPVHYAVLRSMQKAVYSPRSIGHYALHWEHYCHFTSPIRRYPDLLIHRMFADWEAGRRPAASHAELRALGEHCSEREQRAEAAERELVKLKLLYYLHERIGLRMQAVITGVEEFGLFAEGIELPAEGFVAVSSLPDDSYRYDRAAHALVGFRHAHQYRLGDTIHVEVAHVDLARRELDFRIVGPSSVRSHVVVPGSRPQSTTGRSRPPAKPPTDRRSNRTKSQRPGRRKKT